MKDKDKISWTALQYSRLKENMQTQIGIAFIMGCILVGTLVYKNFTLGALIVISAVIMRYIKKRESIDISIDIHSKGISVNNVITEYDRISAFYIDHREERNYLLFTMKETFMGANKILIIEPEVDIEGLREYLLGYLPEKKINLMTSDRIINLF